MCFRKLIVFGFAFLHAPLCMSFQEHASPEECQAFIAKIASDYERIRKLHNKDINIEKTADGKMVVDHGDYTETMYCDGAKSRMEAKKK